MAGDPLELIDEKFAKRFGHIDLPLRKDQTVRRYWDDIGPDIAPTLVAHLRANSSAKYNTARHTVEDPLVNREKLDGTWRCTNIEYDSANEKNRIVQTLKLGYITTLISGGTIDWTEAELEPSRRVSATERTMNVRWNSISSEDVDAVSNALNAATYTNVAILGTAITGTWYNNAVQITWEDDGSAVINMYLSLDYRKETTTEDLGSLKPETVIKYFGVPTARLAAVELLHASAADRQNVSLIKHYDYTRGVFDVIARTTNFAEENRKFTIGESANTDRYESKKFNQVKTQLDGFITAEGLKTKEAGKRKRLVETLKDRNTWDLTAVIESVDLTTTITVVPLANINSASLDRIRPNLREGTESEIQRHTWFNIGPSFIGAARSALENAPAGWHITRISDDYNVREDTWTIKFELTWTGTIEHQTHQQKVAGDTEVHLYELLRRDTEPDLPEEEGYVATQRQVNNPENVQSDYIHTLERVGTVDHQAQVLQPDVEASRIRVEQLNRDVTDEFLPPAPALVGYEIIEGPDLRGPGDRLRDIIYILQKKGTTNWTVNSLERAPTGTAEGERRHIMCLHRSAAPVPEPTISGFKRVALQLDDPDAVLTNYRYTFQRIGTKTTLWTRVFAPVGAAKRVTVIYFARTSEPVYTSVQYALETATGEKYVLIDVIKRGLENVLPDFMYVFGKVSTETGTGLTLIGVRSNGYFMREVYIEKHVADTNLFSRIAFLIDWDNWPADKIVADVVSRYTGSGLNDIVVTLIRLPVTTTDVQDQVALYDGPFKATEYVGATRSVVRPTAHGNVPTSSAGTAFAARSDVAVVYPIGGLAGRVLRKSQVSETVAYHKFEPAFIAATGSWTNYTYYKKYRDRQYGFWVLVGTNIVTGNWQFVI